ncbi:hypothetical protein PK35_03520 [Tamlana nanhaiensis]|uniref:DUF3157 domain-containing protein n=1 Tax=Neotamlana nanhaiensis TaxID=1382798 RepID=A0A0D7W420_9FLAO|nr:DUF3157 family protein [Tamlana nanhaiensis]KJD33831.1 hypothetical protein PK35_03520 [Tamlana nanhaiensis]
MKNLLFLAVFLVSFFSFSQNNYIVKTEDGRRVLLKADFTWEYIDMPTENNQQVATLTEAKDAGCNLGADFEEPKLNKKIQSQLKKGRATMNHVKEKVAKDHNCTVNDVVLISVSEQKSKAVYVFCANGKSVKYKRVGLNVIEAGKLF